MVKTANIGFFAMSHVCAFSTVWSVDTSLQ